MRFIANYVEFASDELLNHLETHKGDTVPVWQPDRWSGHPMLDEARERARIGYSDNKHFFQQFNQLSADMKDYNLLLPPIPDDDRKTVWWMIKLLPGQMQSMHFDPHLIDCINPRRYTLFLQDWEPGHIFVYDDKIITNHKRGDLYEWTDPMCYHGVVNIGYTNRYSLQITTFDTDY
jgi:hypothetical protein